MQEKKVFKKCNFEVKINSIDNINMDAIMIMTDSVYTIFKNDKSYIILNTSLYEDTCEQELLLNKVKEIQIYRYDSSGVLLCIEHYNNCDFKYRLVNYDYNDAMKLQATYGFSYENYSLTTK